MFASICTLATIPALAQRSPSSQRAPTSQSTPSPAAASPSTPAAPEDPAVEEARAHYNRGIALFNDGDYKLALIEIQRSYEMSHNWRILYNLGQVDLQLNRYAEAMSTLERYLHEGGTEVPQQHQVDVARQLAALRDRTAHITITTNVPGVDISIDDTSVGTTPLPPNMLVDAGTHKITATKADFRTSFKNVTLVGMEQQSVVLNLTREAVAWRPAQASPPNYVWVGWVTTGALTVGAVTTGLLAYNASNQANDLRHQMGIASDAIPNELSTEKAWGLAADILTGAAIAAGGVSLYFTLRKSKKEAPPTSAPPPTLGFGPGNVSLRGSF
jgi:tetratricopeptide (TPR) repeat protein